MERVTGIEPVASPWQGDILPLYDTRTCFTVYQKLIHSASGYSFMRGLVENRDQDDVRYVRGED